MCSGFPGFCTCLEQLGPGGLFKKRPETSPGLFGPISGSITPFISGFVTPRFKTIKIRNPLGFSDIKNMLKDQLLKTSGLQFDKWVFGPEKFSGFPRKRARAIFLPQ